VKRRARVMAMVAAARVRAAAPRAVAVAAPAAAREMGLLRVIYRL
jgi:hypothetical protein